MRSFAVKAGVLACLLLVCSVGSSIASEVDRLFWERRWDELPAMVSSDISDREMSLIANGLWTQGKWADALTIIESLKDRYPAKVAPYGSMLYVLGLERTGRIKEAYDSALSLYLSSPPEDLVYYVCYSLSRLTTNDEERRKWLRRMVESTDDGTLKAQTLEQLMLFPDPSLADASAMLKIRALNDKALALFKKAPASRERSYRLGYAAYLKGRDDEAIKYLSKVPLSGPFAQSSLYYRSMSLYRLKRYGEALPLLSRLIFMDGSDFIARGTKRISLIGERGHREEALKILYRASRELPGEGALTASSSYASLLSGDERVKEQDRIIKNHPGSKAASSILWERAWNRWDDGDYRGALELFRKASDGRASGLAEHLYWAGRCLEKLGEVKKAKGTFDELVKNHPLSVYSFMAVPDHALSFDDQGKTLRRVENELERWGFALHSKMLRSNSSDPNERYNGAWLASWMGQEDEAYRAARPLAPFTVGGKGFPVDLVRFLHPRPFASDVGSAAARFSVEPEVVWSIMKQESAFNSSAVSWVGASGLMQLMPGTAKWEAETLKIGSYDVFSVRDNVTLGTAHISRLIRTYPRLEWALAAYNAGGGNVNKWNRNSGKKPLDLWMEGIPFTETRGYVKNVLGNLFVYKQLYGHKGESK